MNLKKTGISRSELLKIILSVFDLEEEQFFGDDKKCDTARHIFRYMCVSVLKIPRKEITDEYGYSSRVISYSVTKIGRKKELEEEVKSVYAAIEASNFGEEEDVVDGCKLATFPAIDPPVLREVEEMHETVKKALGDSVPDINFTPSTVDDITHKKEESVTMRDGSFFYRGYKGELQYSEKDDNYVCTVALSTDGFNVCGGKTQKECAEEFKNQIDIWCEAEGIENKPVEPSKSEYDTIEPKPEESPVETTTEVKNEEPESIQGQEVVKLKSGIIRHTNEAYDERFYYIPDKINTRTGTNWFPAFHFITSQGSPMMPSLVQWYVDKGYEAYRIFHKKQESGSWIHDRLDVMVQSFINYANGSDKPMVNVTGQQIEDKFKNPKEAADIKKCFLGFINWVEEYQPQFIETECIGHGDDFAFTVDLKCKLNVDDYKEIWIVDYKTSSAVFEEHLMQVNAIAKAEGLTKAAVLLLGNKTIKRFSFKEVKHSKPNKKTLSKNPNKKMESEYLWEKFQAIKETAYINMFQEGRIQPRDNEFPESFSLEGIKATAMNRHADKNETNEPTD